MAIPLKRDYDPAIVRKPLLYKRAQQYIRGILSLLGVCLAFLFSASENRAQGLLENSAVVLAYFHIGEDGPAATTLGLDDFHEHLIELKEPDISPLPLTQIVSLLQQKKELPSGTIGVTFENAHKSLLDRAIPALMERDIPFTIFVNPQAIDGKNTQYMSWDDIETLKRSGHASFGLTLASLPADEAEVKRTLNKAITRFREALGMEPRLFAYPQGQYTPALKTFVKQAGFTAAFGLQSGALYEGADFMALPRFTMTGAYGDLERLEGIARTLPLPATDIQPEASVVDGETALIGFSLPPGYKALAPHIRCLASNQGKIEPQILGDSRLEIRPQAGWGERLRVNCTVPAEPENRENQSLRWIGFLLYAEEALEGSLTNPAQGGLPPPPE